MVLKPKKEGKMSSSTTSSECKRCAKCCVVLNLITGSWEQCKYLEGNHCRVYDTRLGRKLGYGFRCLEPKDWVWDIPDCAYFTGEKPIHPAYKE